MRKLTLGILLTLTHGALTVFTFVWVYGHTIDYVLDGKPVPKFFYRALDIASDVLQFPLVAIALKNGKGWFPGLWAYIPILLNSALWVTALLAFFTWGYRTWVVHKNAQQRV